MKNRSPLAVFLLSVFTFGFYGLYWMVVTTGEMNSQGAKVPTAWLIIVPIVNIWWMWKYSEGVEHVTKGKLFGILAFILLWLLSYIGMAIVQDSFNKVEGAAEPAAPASPAGTPPAAA